MGFTVPQGHNLAAFNPDRGSLQQTFRGCKLNMRHKTLCDAEQATQALLNDDAYHEPGVDQLYAQYGPCTRNGCWAVEVDLGTITFDDGTSYKVKLPLGGMVKYQINWFIGAVCAEWPGQTDWPGCAFP